MKQVIVSADDFGLSEAVNEAVERAHREGFLTTASLMVAAPAAADAVRRARANPRLRVGLHLVAVEGKAVLPAAQLPAVVDARGMFPPDQLRLSLLYAFNPAARRQLAAEIHAQFAAFAETGLRLDHANAHKHMHLHPVVGSLLISAGLEFGLPALRIPAEPPSVLVACGHAADLGDRALHTWTRLLRRQARRAGLTTNDHVFGIAWSGHMTRARVLRLIPHLPDGLSEIYFHPAITRDATLRALMPGYEHTEELAALCDPKLQAALKEAGVEIAGYGAISSPAAPRPAG